MKTVFVLCLTLLSFSAAIAGESLADKKYWQGQMEYLEPSMKAANEACGVKFTFDWVKKDDLKTKAEPHNGSPNGVCSSIVDEVGSLCADADAKKAVAAKIKGFKCGWADKRTIDLKGKIVTYMGNNTESGFSDWAKPWLMKNL